MRRALMALQGLLCALSYSCTQGTDKGEFRNHKLELHTLYIGNRRFDLESEWPIEKDIVTILGYGKREITKYGYRREYVSSACCKKVQFYFESDDLLFSPASKINFVDIKFPPGSCMSRNGNIRFKMLKVWGAPGEISHNLKGITVYDMGRYKLAVHGDSCDITLNYDY